MLRAQNEPEVVEVACTQKTHVEMAAVEGQTLGGVLDAQHRLGQVVCLLDVGAFLAADNLNPVAAAGAPMGGQCKSSAQNIYVKYMSVGFIYCDVMHEFLTMTRAV